MDRFYLKPEEWTGETLRLSGEEGHHAARVMRKEAGDAVEIFDGAGRWAHCRVEAVSKAELTLAIEKEGRDGTPNPAITLAVAMPKGKTMDLIVQKAVELGVHRIQPLATTNTVVKLTGKDCAEKAAKWQRVALEACKQCGQNVLPRVSEVRDLGDYLADSREGYGIVGSLAPGARGFREHLAALPTDKPIHLLVGPEGDFTEPEMEAALAADFQPVTLGNIVLRVETACLFLISAVRYQSGE
jgi:16S rRNA (uracil1498-N3)-methyltransferase